MADLLLYDAGCGVLTSCRYFAWILVVTGSLC